MSILGPSFAAAQTWILSRDCLHYWWRHIVTSKGYYACSTILQFLEFSRKTVVLCRRKKNYRVFSLTWPASVCKFIGTKESFYIRKEFNFHRTSLGHQHGRRFIVLGPIWPPWRHVKTLHTSIVWTHPDSNVMQRVSRYNSDHDLLCRTGENRTNNNIDWNLEERYWTVWSLFLSFKIWSFKAKSPGSELESARSAFNWDMN